MLEILHPWQSNHVVADVTGVRSNSKRIEWGEMVAPDFVTGVACVTG